MMTNSIVIIDKAGDSSNKKVKDIQEDKLYSKCGFKNGNNFERRHAFKVKGGYVFVYSKDSGRSNLVNKFEMPPPIDTVLYYGNILLVKSSSSSDFKPLPYTSKEWENDYEKLMGGFEDINDNATDDENEEDELSNIPKEKLTKQGYLKDGFVVSNESEGDEDDDSESDVEEEESNENNEEDINADDENDEEADETDGSDDELEETTPVEEWSEEEDDDNDYMSELEEEDYLSE
jgi:hypothetical protein